MTSGESRLPLFADAALASAPSSAHHALPVASLEQLAPSLDLGFVGLADYDTVGVTQLAVRVKGRPGTTLRLRVNGRPLPETRVGRRVVAHAANVEAWEYLGVELEPGVNVLEVAPPRSVGRVALRVVAPGPLAHVALETPRRPIADGRTPAPLAIRLTDAKGVPVGARTIVTLETTLGAFTAPDLDPAAPGVQVAVEGGLAELALVAPATPGRARLGAAAGALRAASVVDFGPDLRPLLALGSLEGTVSFGKLHRGPNAPLHPETGFESWASQFRSERRDGDASAVARGALFVKGRVFEDVLLTLGYATDKPEGLRRFRDIQPEAFYPVYGDASVRGYEAQSTGRLYARADRGAASLLYGDFVTRGSGSVRSLAGYQRSLTGVQHHYEDERVRVDAFTSRERTRRRVDELPGLGVSGPYVLPGAPIVENSERVEVIVRDRNQPAVVLSANARSRFTDYEIDPFEGRIVFKQPVPSVDADLNPVYVRVGYEVESDGEPFWVSGAEARVKLTPRLEAGGSYVDDHDPEKPSELRSLSIAAKLSPKTTLEAEWAVTQRIGGSRGDGARFDLHHESGAVQGYAFGSATGADFDNPGAGFGAGRTEAGARLTGRVDPRTSLRLEALYSADAFARDQRGGVLVGVDRVLARGVQGELGVRVAGEDRRTGFEEPTSYALRARLQAQAPGRPDVTGFAEYEQSVMDARRLVAVGGEYRLAGRGRVYARHELVSSLAGEWALRESQRRLSTVLGVDTDVRPDTRVFSEYRLGDGLSGREGEAALGLRNLWTVDGVMRIGTSFERVSPLAGATTGPATAVTGSIEYAEGERWKGSTRVEVRTSRASDGFLATMAAACRVDSSWTMLGRHQLSFEDARASGTHARLRFQLGAAYRDATHEAWDALTRYEFRYDRDTGGSPFPHRRLAHVLALQSTGPVGGALEATLGWAGKVASERADGFRGVTGAQRGSARASIAFGRDWDASVAASAVVGRTLRQRRDALGAEIGRQLGAGVWLSAGWNRFGYEDDELAGTDWTREGGFLRIRARFDDELLRPARGRR